MAKGNKTGGRKLGTPNKTTAELRQVITSFVSANIEDLQLHYDKLSVNDKMKVLDRMLQYSLPKLSQSALQVEPIKKNLPEWMTADCPID